MEKKKKNTVEESQNPTENVKKIDAIKKLIFGENMEEYDHKFHDLFDKLDELHEEFESKIGAVTRKLTADTNKLAQKSEDRFELLQKELESQVQKLNDSKTDRRALGKMLSVISEKLQE